MPYPETTVSAVIFNPDDRILLCKSHKWENKYVIPGGHIEKGESMEEALRREILEETGLQIRDIRLLSIKESIFSKTFYEDRHFIFIDYQCRTDSDRVVLNDEAEEYAWIALEEIEDYELGGFTESLLLQMRDREASEHRVEVFYNY